MLKRLPFSLPGNWIGVCVQSMFCPSEYAMHFIQPYLDRFQGHYIFGMHIRSGGRQADWRDGKFDMKPSTVWKYSKHILKLMKKQKSLLFLSSDSQELATIVKHMIGKRVIMVTNLPTGHSGRSPNEGILLRSFMDLYLLGQCDSLYLTRTSGFSFIAGAFNKHGKIFWM